MKRCTFLVLGFLLCLSGVGQSGAYIGVKTPSEIPWEELSISGKRFIVTGEAHNVSCNYPFQLSELKYLVSKGFRHLVWEVPFSYGLIAQEYINTGNDSLFQFIGGYKELEDYWKGVYQLNKEMAAGDKLHLWGIDHEIGENSGSLNRARLFIKALHLLVEDKGELPVLLQKEFQHLKFPIQSSALREIKHRLNQMQELPEIKDFLGSGLTNFQILVNRLDYYKVKRNDEMLEAFNEICTLFKLDSSAKFLGRFGWGHIDKSYRHSMSYLLENDLASPVKNSTYVVGVQYIDCAAFSSRASIVLENEGVVNDRAQKRVLRKFQDHDTTPIKIFQWPAGKSATGWKEEVDVLFVFSGYGGIEPVK